MRIKFGFLSLAVLLMQPSFSFASEKRQLSLDEVCKITACRTANVVKLHYDADYAEVNLEKAPYYYDGLLNIVAGEKLYFEANEKEDRLVDIKKVDKITYPEKTITFDFKQVVDSPQKTFMLLSISNPFKKALKLKILTHQMNKDGFQFTSSCPVLPGQTNYESWPNIIYQLALSDFQLLDTKTAEKFECK
jgi:hypothetical protein